MRFLIDVCDAFVGEIEWLMEYLFFIAAVFLCSVEGVLEILSASMFSVFMR